MRVLIVGSGGREHALAWACARSSRAPQLICAPGNAGTAELGENVAINAVDAEGIAALVSDRSIDLVVVGPDAALAAGVADACRTSGTAVFGPSAAAARIESSKEFAKALMDASGIATAAWMSGDVDDRDALLAFALARDGECVVKADGLALGKGVTVCDDMSDASRAIHECLDDQRFGSAARRVVVEERLDGQEVSVFAICDGNRSVLLPPVCDYKRAYDGDRGPNTGGMGAYTPPHGIDRAAILRETGQAVVAPTLSALAERGTPFVGCLYVGLMLTEDGPRVLEFNARFGDPEAQALMPLLGADVLDLLDCAAHGTLDAGYRPTTGHAAAVTVVIAAAGYPESGVSKTSVELPRQKLDDVVFFHAATHHDAEGKLQATGGRILAVTGVGGNVEAARERAYAGVAAVHVDDSRWRTDIGAIP